MFAFKEKRKYHPTHHTSVSPFHHFCKIYRQYPCHFCFHIFCLHWSYKPKLDPISKTLWANNTSFVFLVKIREKMHKISEKSKKKYKWPTYPNFFWGDVFSWPNGYVIFKFYFEKKRGKKKKKKKNLHKSAIPYFVIASLTCNMQHFFACKYYADILKDKEDSSQFHFKVEIRPDVLFNLFIKYGLELLVLLLMNGIKLYVRDNCVKMNIVDLFLWCIFVW